MAKANENIKPNTKQSSEHSLTELSLHKKATPQNEDKRTQLLRVCNMYTVPNMYNYGNYFVQ